ncbi:transglutaminase N-terminal domain-containing protein [Aeromicrobium sp. CF4.19]|uniref:transglutaminase family protein n=1 Tax=Aeromicrobium sp. CF4.19 TaxID=3373082 RepID=UPI003EE524DD
MRYDVRHRTTYTYDAAVSESHGLAHVVPRELPWQRVERWSVMVRPEPSDVAHDVDHEGNITTWFQVDQPHLELTVDARSTVEVERPVHDDAALSVAWEQARPAARPDVEEAWRAQGHVLASPAVALSEGAHAYVASSLEPGRPLGEVVHEVSHRIHQDFAYRPGATSVSSSVDDVLAARAGVCQDFAHLMLSGLRSHGLAARYVSGYLLTQPPPGRERLVGADASHAWLAVWVPDDGWLAIDPTNDQLVDDHYVTVAWGRDYKDVPPVKGVIVTEAESSTLSVGVDVVPL